MEGDFCSKFSKEVDKISKMEESHQSVVMVNEHECGFHFSINEVNKFGYIKFYYWVNCDSFPKIFMNVIFRYFLQEIIYLNEFERLLFLLDLWLSYLDLIKQRVNKEGRHLYRWIVKGVKNIENT